MTAFDQAWDLAKMPIVPGSIERVDASDGGLPKHILPNEYQDFEAAHEYPIGIWNAKFEHPDTGKIHPMQLRANMSRRVYPALPRFIGNIGYDDARAIIAQQVYTENEEKKFIPTSVGTKEEQKRKGMATALYDMAAKILDEHDARLMRTHDTQSLAAKKLWGNRKKWPVRDDL